MSNYVHHSMFRIRSMTHKLYLLQYSFPHRTVFLYIPGILETCLPITQSFCFHINYMGYTQKMRFFDLSVWKTSSSEAFLLPLTSAQLWVWRILLI